MSVDPTKKKYVWMDRSIHDTPDPNWNQAEAVRLGIIPAPSSVGGSGLVTSTSFAAMKSDAQFTRQLLNLDTADDHSPE
jgi:hypothetical protein